MKRNDDICLAFSDYDGNLYDFPGIEPAFRTGNRFTRIKRKDLIKLPYGSYLYSLPGRYPVFYNHKNSDFNHIAVSPDGFDILASSAFLASGYLRTYLPAYIKEEDAPLLPMWAYAGLVIIDGEFHVPALRIDEDIRSDPVIHENHEELSVAIQKMSRAYPENRLVKQLARCSREFNCLCARNFFLERHEAPVPASPSCNAGCMGCLSHQESASGLAESQERITFSPEPHEIAQVILHHVKAADDAVASFGQGCEGEPLLRAGDIAGAISMVRRETGRGTINMNTNGSLPGAVELLIRAGLDSIRISLNSPTEKYYDRYYQPRGYSFDDVKRSLDIAINSGIFVSLNLFFMPGFTDMETEAESLMKFLDAFPVSMIQTRNLNIDPDYYFESLGYEESDPLGIPVLLKMLRERYPQMKLGYYNPPVKK